MKTLLTLTILLFTTTAFAATGLLTEEYGAELEQNIAELEAVIDAGLGSDRDAFMLDYYSKRLAKIAVTSKGAPTRAVFTTQIVDKEPVNALRTVSATAQQVYFFTELLNLSGKVATHRWSYKGQVVFSKEFRVGSDRWRVWTQKTITPYAGGMVVVQIMVDGQVITQETLQVTR